MEFRMGRGQSEREKATRESKSSGSVPTLSVLQKRITKKLRRKVGLDRHENTLLIQKAIFAYFPETEQ